MNLRRFADPLNPPDGVCPREAASWNAILDRNPRLEALVEERDRELDEALAQLRDRHEEDGVRLSIPALPVLASPHRLTAYERLVLAALTERASDGIALMTVSELTARLRPNPLTSDAHRVERSVFRLLTRRFIARRSGGGFVLLRRAA